LPRIPPPGAALLIYHFAVEFIGPDTLRGQEFAGLCRYPGFRRAFTVITAVWGPASSLRLLSGYC
jgi:hypothetical protein